jgi:alpha-N-arabinofuranosidase
VNIDAKKAHDINIVINGGAYKSVTGRILTSDKLQNHNTFDNPGKIKPAPFTGATVSNAGLKVKIPPFSVIVLELK